MKVSDPAVAAAGVWSRDEAVVTEARFSRALVGALVAAAVVAGSVEAQPTAAGPGPVPAVVEAEQTAAGQAAPGPL